MKFLPIAFMLIYGPAFAGTYYVDWVNGSDSNNGTSKTTAWKHLPGMPACSSNCHSASPQPGDRFILKGGVTWPNSSLGWEWLWSGNASQFIYIGVDPTWYAGISWTRPTFNGQGSAIPTWIDSNGSSRSNEFFGLSASYVILDNIEWTGFYEYWTNNYCQDNYICLHYSSTNLEIKNNYFHGWTHAPYNGGTSSDGGQCITGDTSSPSGNSNSSIHDNVFDGADTAGDSMAALHGGPETVYNNYVNNMTNGFVGEYTSVHDNVIYYINNSYNPTNHENGIEINFAPTNYVYNNVIAHVSQGLAVWLTSKAGYTSYFYNNLVWDIPITNIIDLAAALQNCCGQSQILNNTIECGQDGGPTFVCVGIGAMMGPVTLKNNYGITNATSPNKGMWFNNGSAAVVESNDLIQSYSVATSKGYTSTESHSFSPPSNCTQLACLTVQAGVNLTSLCSSLPGLCSDTTLGVSYSSANHTVSYPARTPNPRPVTGNWDVGAYQFNSTGGLPNQPTAMTVVLQ